MKVVISFFAILLTATFSQAAFIECAGPSQTSPNDAGYHFVVDEIGRVQELKAFEGGSETGSIDLSSVLNPTAYVKYNPITFNIEVFTFHTFNDGLEEDINVTFVADKPEVSKLQWGAQSGGVDNITCYELEGEE